MTDASNNPEYVADACPERDMLTTALKVALTFMLLAFAAAPAPADTTAALSWADLIPKSATEKGALDALSPDHQKTIEYIAWARNMQSLGLMREDSGSVWHAVLLAETLEAQGLDVDALVALMEARRHRQQRQRRSFVGALDGTAIRIDGYVLPIKRAGQKSTEFLLVPSLRACSHAPPTPNQAIYVRVDDGLQLQSLFRPIHQIYGVLRRLDAKAAGNRRLGWSE